MHMEHVSEHLFITKNGQYIALHMDHVFGMNLNMYLQNKMLEMVKNYSEGFIY